MFNGDNGNDTKYPLPSTDKRGRNVNISVLDLSVDALSARAAEVEEQSVLVQS